MVKRILKNIYLSPPNLAPLRLGGRNFQIREFSTPENLRQSRKFRAMVVQSSENFLIKNWFTLRPEPVLSDVEGRLRGAICEPCFTSKPEDPRLKNSNPLLILLSSSRLKL